MGFYKDKKIETAHINDKKFSYKKTGGARELTLSFTLNIDDERELSNYISMLKEAQDELQEEIRVSAEVKKIRLNGNKNS